MNRSRAQRLRADLPQKSGKRNENMGEAEAIILAGDLASEKVSVLVIDEHDGGVAAIGRGVNALGAVYVCLLAALLRHRSDDEAWDLYERLVHTAGLGIPRSGWQADAAGGLQFHHALVQWRAALVAKGVPVP